LVVYFSQPFSVHIKKSNINFQPIVRFVKVLFKNTKTAYRTLFKKRVNLDAGKFSFGNRVCDEWIKLPGWVVNVESMNEFEGNLDHYLRNNRGFK